MKRDNKLLKLGIKRIVACILIFLGAFVSILTPLIKGLGVANASSNNSLSSVYPSQMTKLSLSLVYTGAEVDGTVNSIQSLAITDKYFVAVQANTVNENTGWIVATDLKNPSSKPAWKVKYNVGHGNGATWDSRRDKIVVVNGATKLYFDADNGKFLNEVTKGPAASAIAYDADDDWYIQANGADKISGRILDSDFNQLKTFDASHRLVSQDIAYHDGYIYRIAWGGCDYLKTRKKNDADAAYCNKYFGEGSNVIYAFDMNGDFLEAYYIDKGFGELESMAFSKDGTPYLLFNGKPDNVHYSVYRINNFRHNVTSKVANKITEIQKIDNEALREELLRQIGASDQVDDANVVADQPESFSDVANQPSDPSDVASKEELDEKNGDNSGVNIGEASDTIVVRDSSEVDTGETPDMTIRESDETDIGETLNVTAVEVSDEVSDNEVTEVSTENHSAANENDAVGITTKVITTVATMPDSEVATGFENEATQPEPVVRVAVVAVSNKDEVYGVIDGDEVIDDSNAREVARADEGIKYTELLNNTKEKSNTVDKQNVVAKNENNKVHEDATEPDAVKETTVDENVNTESNLDVPTTGKSVKAEDNKTFDANKVIVITAVVIGCLAIAFCIIVAIRALR